MDPIFTSIGTILALIVGYFLKKNPNFQNRFIPIATFIISLLTQIVATAQPAQAAINLGGIFSGFGNILVNSLIQTLLATGAHSVGKNTIFRPNR